MTRYIRNLVPYGDGWSWEWFKPFDNVWKPCNTNKSGEGLWIDDKQVLGTCQFEIDAGDLEYSKAYNKIRALHTKFYGLEIWEDED